MKKTFIVCSCVYVLTFSHFVSNAQNRINGQFGDGISMVAQDSSFSLTFSPRMQLLYDGVLNTGTEEWSDQAMVRRARLKFKGFAYHPSLTYELELGLSNSDTDGATDANSNTAKIILDAVLMWEFHKNFSLWFGQAKLPGTRANLVSSQELQFVDRSILNDRFTLERAFGVQVHHKFAVGKVVFREAFAISMGEGRNYTADNRGGHDYTARFEVLPFGDFDDYVVTDFERSSTPLLSAGVVFDYNDGASREGGQTGDFLAVERDLRTWLIDALFKYNGFSAMAEYADKKAPDGPLVRSGNDFVTFYTGMGLNLQAGYLFKNNIEIAGRYAMVRPDAVITENDHDQYTLGVSKYIARHNLKVQSDITLISEETQDDAVAYRLQVELSL